MRNAAVRRDAKVDDWICSLSFKIVSLQVVTTLREESG